MLAVQLDAGFFLNEGELLLDLDADFLFLVGESGGLFDLIGELDGLARDQFIERRGGWHGWLPAEQVGAVYTTRRMAHKDKRCGLLFLGKAP